MGKRFQREPMGRKKGCRFCKDKDYKLDMKDAKAFRSFITERDKILPARITGSCAYHQRRLTRMVKKARVLGIIAYSSSQRGMV